MAQRTWMIGWAAAMLGMITVADGTFAETRVSGTIVSVAPDGAAIAFEELGLAGQVVRHMVTLAPDARVVHVTREPQHGEFVEHPADARDLRAGDFVTVTVEGGGPGLPPRTTTTTNVSDASGMASPASDAVVARTVEVVRPR